MNKKKVLKILVIFFIGWGILSFAAYLIGIVFTDYMRIDPVIENEPVIYVRLKNNTENDFYRLKLGKDYEKRNSYRMIDYSTIYRDLPSGSLSEYQQIRGVEAGYNQLVANIDVSGDTYYRTHENIVDTINNSYFQSFFYSYPAPLEKQDIQALKPGKYTFEFVSIPDYRDKFGVLRENGLAVSVFKDE